MFVQIVKKHPILFFLLLFSVFFKITLFLIENQGSRNFLSCNYSADTETYNSIMLRDSEKKIYLSFGLPDKILYSDALPPEQTGNNLDAFYRDPPYKMGYTLYYLRPTILSSLGIQQPQYYIFNINVNGIIEDKTIGNYAHD